MECLPIIIDAPPADATPADACFDRERQVAFLEALAEGGAVRRAAARAGVSHMTAYRARRASAPFRRAWDAALLAARALAEDVLATRAIDGVEEEVWYHGEVIATRRRYDARLLLAHLARLDRLCADARTEAFAGDFDAALARFAQGEEAVPDMAGGAEGVFAPGQCNNCNMPEAEELAEEEAEEACPDCGGRCLDPDADLTQADCQWLGNRLDRMDAARPRGARRPGGFPGHTADEVEMEQLAAFEAGAERWWLVVPPDDDAPGSQDADGWVREADAP
jgi:hypothetical protein